jgi:hypothetical protein
MLQNRPQFGGRITYCTSFHTADGRLIAPVTRPRFLALNFLIKCIPSHLAFLAQRLAGLGYVILWSHMHAAWNRKLRAEGL